MKICRSCNNEKDLNDYYASDTVCKRCRDNIKNGMRKCSTCKTEKHATNFKNKSLCKDCFNVKRRQSKMDKLCRSCKRRKDTSEFYYNDKFYCKSCRDIINNGYKICSKCNEEKHRINFSIDNNKGNICKMCRNKDGKKEKICQKCREKKMFSEFYGANKICNDCIIIQKNIENDTKSQNTKICNSCNIEKNVSEFYERHCQCKECIRELSKKRRERDKMKKENSELYIKNCNKCKRDLYSNNFRINRRTCLECERAAGRTYRRNNPEKSREWSKQNKERHRELIHKHYVENKKYIRQKEKDNYYNREKVKIIINHKAAISKLIKYTIKNSGYLVKGNREILIKWLEYNFDEDMTLDNYGEVWCVDHVLPRYLYLNGNEDFEIICLWCNIIPTRKEYNLTKNKYVDPVQIEQHKDVLEDFMEKENINDEYIYNYTNKLINYIVADE